LFFFLLATQICFAQWYPQNSGTTQHLNKVQFVDANTGWAVGDSGTIIYTTNAGADWMQQASGTNLNIVDISFVNANTGWILGRMDGSLSILLKTTNGGISWSQQIQDSFYFNAVCFIDENIGWLVSDSILKTTDGGNSWIPKPTIIYEHGISDVQFLDAFTGFAIGSSSTILKSTDGGDNWIIQMFHGYGVTWNRISFSDAENGCVVSTDNPFVNGGRITHTTNGGADWIYTQHPPGIFHDLCSINSNIVYVVGRKYINGYNIKGLILRSSDAITSWDEQLFEIDKAFNGVHFLDDNIGWVVGDSGTILHTTNGGVTFIDNETTQPTEFLLSQNFPNPFNPSTKISWQSPVGSHQTIKVFDVLGNELQHSLMNTNRQEGMKLSLTQSRLASGIYFYKLQAVLIGRQAGDLYSEKKMILIK
jgi:photosystem II stability/assembly factor-like uncharacterized protein